MGILCLSYFLAYSCWSCTATDIANLIKGKDKQVIRHADGIEFSGISRGSLLQVLAAFEQNLLSRFMGKKVKPLFTADFANNKYTRPFIYPKRSILRYGLKMQPGLVSTYPDPGFWTKTSLIQLGYGIWVNLTLVVTGLAFGFTGVALPQIKDSNIIKSITDESWITSVLTLSAPPGCIVCGYLMDKLGRRMMLIISHFPVAVGWLYMGFAKSATDLIIGRVVTGFGIGMTMNVPRPYLTEISLPNMRGVIGSFPNLAMSIGITVTAGIGSIFKWNILCYIFTFYSTGLMALNYFLPETPYFLLMNDSMESAKASLRKFRSSKHNINAEMDELMDFKMDNDIHRLTWREKLEALLRRSSCRPFFVIITYIIIVQLSGVSIIIMYTVEILKNSNSSMDLNTGNFLLGITRLISATVASILIFRVGRKPLALISGLSVGAVCVSLGIFIHHEKLPTIVPQISFMAYTMFAALGHYPLPALIMSEIYPLQVRGILGGITMSLFNLIVFGVNNLYPYVISGIGFANTIVSFGICSLLGSLYLYFYLPETKDLTLQEIEEYYNERRPTLMSQRRIMSVQAFSRQTLNRSDTASRSLIRITDKHKKTKQDKVQTGNTGKKEGSTSQNLP